MKYQDSGNNHCPSGPPFADIIEFLPDPVFAIDRQGSVIAIYCGRRIFGFLGFDSVRTEKEWIPEDIQLLRTVSEIIGIAKMRQMNERESRQKPFICLWKG
jgi:GAF domain-containing protein